MYAVGIATKTLLKNDAITHIPTVKANLCTTPVPKINIEHNTSIVERDVPIDLLIVCHILSSNTSLYENSFFECFIIFSLTLSNIIITSLIQYHMIVRIAIINTVSIWIVESSHIHNQ
jgi:hypothetical protein